MKTATDPALISFEESRDNDPAGSRAIVGCACTHCVAAVTEAGRRPRTGSSLMQRAVRGACLVTTVLAGVGAVGLGAGTAHADSAPRHAGWDGSRYWFKNSAGAWRWTTHQGIYLARTGDGMNPSSGGDGSDSDIQQGWDGSRYWFKNSAGAWRWTTHHSIYLARTSGRTPAPPPSKQRGGTYEAAIDYALAQVGKPYVWGGNGPDGFDCSGLVQQAYRRVGTELPRVADDQYVATTSISPDELRRGDLIFWSNSSRASGIHHVAIYLGGGTYVEAPRPGKNVRISMLSNGYRPTHFGRP